MNKRISITKISDIKVKGDDSIKGREIFLFGVVTRLEEKVDKTKNKYCEFILEDKTGEVIVKIWKTPLTEVKVENSMLVKVGAEVGEWNEKPQLILQKQDENLMLREARDADKVQIMDFVKTAPVEGQAMYDYILAIVDDFTNLELKAISLAVLQKYKEELLFFPGSKTVHHACYSGLLFHIYSMFKSALGLTHYPINIELLYTGILIHDIGKLKELEVSQIGIASDYTKTGTLLGHIIDGVRMMERLFIELNVSDEVSILLHHMITSHHHEQSFGAYQMPKFMEAQLLHHLDLVDSRMNMIENSVINVEEGEFGEKSFFLNNRQMYVPNLSNENPNLTPMEVPVEETVDESVVEEEKVEDQQAG